MEVFKQKLDSYLSGIVWGFQLWTEVGLENFQGSSKY